MLVPNDNLGEKRLLVATFPDQKQTHRIKKNDGTYAELFLGMKEWSLDGWQVNPTVGRALTDCDEIKAGDYVLTQHNAFENKALQISSGLDQFSLDEHEEVYCVAKSLCWFGIRPDGEFFCVGSNMVCQRIYEPSLFTEEDKALVDSFSGAMNKTEVADVRLVMENRKQIKNIVRVQQMSDSPDEYSTGDKKEQRVCMNEIKPGDLIAVYKHSDVEMKYKWDNEMRSLIRVNFERDFAEAIITDLKYEL